MEKILITGGTGLVGQHLAKRLIAKGYEVVMLSRHSGEKNGIKLYRWDIKKGEIDHTAFHGVNHVIHLAGAGVAEKRWTKAFKQEIHDSRVRSLKLLFETVKERSVTLKSFVSASGVSIYGLDPEGIMHESHPPAFDFLAKVSLDWEAAAERFESLGIRTVMLRTGVVLAKESGFIPEVSKPMKFFAGAPLGSGKQWISWIHIDDLCGIYLKAIEDNTMRGPCNAVAPHPVTNKEITVKIGKRLHRPVWLPPVPAFVLQLLVGEVTEILVTGQNVSPQKIEKAGYTFLFPDVDSALDNLL
jgi:uncharacterized protein (TIGR01777 family)